MIALHFICFAQQTHLLLNQLIQYSLEICSERVASYGINSLPTIKQTLYNTTTTESAFLILIQMLMWYNFILKRTGAFVV